MKKFRDLRLSAKFLLSIGAVLVVLTVFDVWFSMKKERDIMYRDIEKWTFVFAENVRTTLNTLMREDKMDIRFSMLDSMSKEIKGVENVRIIRGPRVDEIFRKVKEQEVIPRETQAIEGYREEKARLERELKSARDPDDASDLKEEIESLRDSISKSEENIRKAEAPPAADERELPKDGLDREVLDSGNPIYRFEGDKGRVLIPYISQKSCSTASGCHKYAKEGDVLGAISMEFSIEDIRKEIAADNLKTAGVGILRLAIILGILALFLIEAARAGDQGRGFAVVADEVRKLAERTTLATKEIGGMIKAIQEDTSRAIESTKNEVRAVEEAVGTAGQAGGAIDSILEEVEKVSNMVQQIAAASEQQTAAASQISQDIEAIALVASNRVSDVSQIANAAVDLSRLSSRLKEVTSRFRLGTEEPEEPRAQADESGPRRLALVKP